MSKIKNPTAPYSVGSSSASPEAPIQEPKKTSTDSKNFEADGVDIAAIEYNLSISIEERISNHERARKMMSELIKTREAVDAKRKT